MASVHDGDPDLIGNPLHLGPGVGIRGDRQLVDREMLLRVLSRLLQALLDPVLALHRIGGTFLVAFLELGSSATAR